MAKTEKEYLELLDRANKIIKEQRELIEKFKSQVDWALALLEQSQTIMKRQQETNDKLMKLVKEA